MPTRGLSLSRLPTIAISLKLQLILGSVKTASRAICLTFNFAFPVTFELNVNAMIFWLSL